MQFHCCRFIIPEGVMSGHKQKILRWKDDYSIHSYEVDLTGRLKAASLCQFLQESAWNHAEHLEFGFSHLLKHNLIWVLYRLRLKVYSSPLWGETITVETWPAARDRLYYYRDFRVWGQEQQVVAEAATCWFVIDLEKRQPTRKDDFFKVQVPENMERVFPEKLSKLKPAAELVPGESRRARYSDLDVNGHVNNVRFVDWLWDGLDLDFIRGHDLRELEINYLVEAGAGDEVQMLSIQTDAFTFSHAVQRVSDRVVLCRARTTWEACSRKAGFLNM